MRCALCAPLRTFFRISNAVAALQMLLQQGELRAIAVHFREQQVAISQTDIAPHLGRELLAIRVKSRKPAPAKEKKSAASTRAADHLHQREGKCMRQMAHGGKHRIVLLRIHGSETRSAREPGLSDTHSGTWGSLRSGDDDGAPAEQLGFGCIHAGQFGPRDRMCGHESRSLSRRAARAAVTTSRLVLPPSVTTASGSRCSAICCSTRSVCCTGTATKTRSAPASACDTSAPISSMTASSRARARLACERPIPTTLTTIPERLSASAKDPPMRPTPKTASLRKGAALTKPLRCAAPPATLARSARSPIPDPSTRVDAQAGHSRQSGER